MKTILSKVIGGKRSGEVMRSSANENASLSYGRTSANQGAKLPASYLFDLQPFAKRLSDPRGPKFELNNEKFP